MIALKRIAVPHDLSETSSAAVAYAVALARSFGSEVDVLFVSDRTAEELEHDVPAGADGPVTGAVRERLLKILSPAEQAALNPRFYVRAGVPAVEIVRFARERETDLIVMGTHGRGLMGHLMMGSVAEKVVRTAPCPVLTVRNSPSAQGVEVAAETLELARAAI